MGIPISTFPSSSISSCINLPTEPSPLPEAISEVKDFSVADAINEDHEYGLHSLDNLKPISPTIIAANSNIIHKSVPEDTSLQNNSIDTNMKSEKFPSASKVASNSQV